VEVSGRDLRDFLQNLTELEREMLSKGVCGVCAGGPTVATDRVWKQRGESLSIEDHHRVAAEIEDILDGQARILGLIDGQVPKKILGRGWRADKTIQKLRSDLDNEMYRRYYPCDTSVYFPHERASARDRLRIGSGPRDKYLSMENHRKAATEILGILDTHRRIWYIVNGKVPMKIGDQLLSLNGVDKAINKLRADLEAEMFHRHRHDAHDIYYPPREAATDLPTIHG
jgi:hypothetical protein